MKTDRRERSRTLRLLLKTHRTAGLVSAAFVLLLATTGIMLQHTDGLGLDERFLRGDYWLAWYGMELPEPGPVYVFGDHEAALLGDRLYVDGVATADNLSALSGAVALAELLVIAAPDRLLLLTDSGLLLETVTSVHGLPEPVRSIGLDSGNTVYLSNGSGIIRADLDTLAFESAEYDGQLTWSQPFAGPTRWQQQIREDYSDRLLSWERLVLDLHSGRIAGRLGILWMDAMAILFMLMALTGILIWSRRSGKRVPK